MKTKKLITAFAVLFSSIPALAQVAPEQPAVCGAQTSPDSVGLALEGVQSKMEAIEQISSFGTRENQECGARLMREEETALLEPWSAQIGAAGIVTHDLDYNWDEKSWSGQGQWLASLGNADASGRCRMLRMAYIMAVYRLDTLDPSVEIRTMKDMRLRDSHGNTLIDDEALRIDRARASWELRYLRGIPAALIPQSCAGVVAEAGKRWNFIHDSDRRPLGIAYGMCGRPLAGHYLDDEADAGARPHPAGWSTESRQARGQCRGE
jgi:hypothetical protein